MGRVSTFVLPNHNMNCSLQIEDAGNDTSAVLFTICGEDTQTSLDMQKQETSPAIEQHRTLNRSRRHHLQGRKERKLSYHGTD
jgi:hypothetical protein